MLKCRFRIGNCLTTTSGVFGLWHRVFFFFFFFFFGGGGGLARSRKCDDIVAQVLLTSPKLDKYIVPTRLWGRAKG